MGSTAQLDMQHGALVDVCYNQSGWPYLSNILLEGWYGNVLVLRTLRILATVLRMERIPLLSGLSMFRLREADMMMGEQTSIARLGKLRSHMACNAHDLNI